MKFAPNDLRQKPFGTSTAIRDLAVLSVIKTIKLDLDFDVTDEFCLAYLDWIKSGSLNQFKGLDQFQHYCYSNGTTEAFDKFYIKNHKRRFRCFKGEYVYHRLTWRNSWPDWQYLDQDPLKVNDAVVISLPFSDTGNKNLSYDNILSQCQKLNIPVLIDCAYFGTCADIQFDLDYSCITDITFSLSKVFPVSAARIGIRLTKIDDDDSLFVVNKINYINRLGPQIGLQLIKNFNSDYIYNKYRIQQLSMCDQYQVIPSNTVLFGLGDSSWQEYNRGTTTNRLCFATHYEG